MTEPLSPMEVLPMPPGAIELAADGSWLSARAMAVAALQQVLSSRGAGLPLGPETAADEDGRLLSLNRFALQLCTSGISADQIAIDTTPWAARASAPQLLLSALVDEENAVVAFGGVLTSQEFVALAANAERDGDQLLLDVDVFKGGTERLLTLVQLLDPAAIPRLALAARNAGPATVIDIAAWLQGRVDQALDALGAVLLPPPSASAAAPSGFRAAALAAGLEDSTPLAVLAIPLGLTPDGQLVTGEAARQCIETFQLLLIPSCRLSDGDSPDALILQLTGTLSGDLLPDGLEISASQGRLRQSASTNQSYALSLNFSGPEPIEVSLSSCSGDPLQLPPIQLPQP